MLDFSLPLALFNAIPVLLTGIALWFLVCFVREWDAPHHRLALLGGALIVAGGASKAVWKLIAATTGIDLGWLANALFPLMAPGFALLAVAIWGATRRLRGRKMQSGWWIALLAVLLAFSLAAVRHWILDIPRGWFLPLLALTSLGNLSVSILLIYTALRWRRWQIALLFAINLAMIFALQPIALATPKTLALHWIEQTLTVFGTGCFALAAYLFLQATKNRHEAGLFAFGSGGRI